jgi:hypothetical protein
MPTSWYVAPSMVTVAWIHSFSPVAWNVATMARYAASS